MKLCVVASHGGHLTEMMEIIHELSDCDIVTITYSSERTVCLKEAYLIDNFAEKPWTGIAGTRTILRALKSEKPNFIISTGAEIAIPAFIIGKMLGIKTIFIESCARVRTPSGSGKIIYLFADHFFVQWKELLRAYGKRARYEGGLL